ncbi:glutathione S-transferase 2 [Podospora australis]|uniref:glutathione transferase n=1 Tax=Podospora australis TaxID=1536484 RepID=A0AAN6WKH5_9PEZI|nr:glutathione S-transferase 2 [Podospora australis]
MIACTDPKPPQAIFLLEELGLNYEIKAIRFDDVKEKLFIDINPNGRYLIEQYDTDKRLSYDSLKEKHLCNQFLHFQMSGQGPAIERYANDIKRILSVLETVLAAKPENEQWLVGDKMKFADMAFLPWNFRLSEVKMAALPSSTRSMERRVRLMDEQRLQWNGVPKGIETFAEYEEKITRGDKIIRQRE